MWLLDGALQFQPYMYEKGSKGFFGPLSQNTMGRPNFITDAIRTLVATGVAHQVLFNVTIGLVQLAIGACLLYGRTTRIALAASAIWAAGVWVGGEALGQMIFPQASMLTGAPGAALVYLVVSLVLWPVRDGEAPGEAGGPGEAGLLGAAGARAAWAVIWCGSALLELESGNFAPRGVSAQLAYSARGEPGAVAWIDKTSAHLAAGHGTIIAFSMLLVELFAGWGIVRAPTRRAALATGIAASLVYWVVGQNFGLMLTGQATDPNLGPVMILFALCLWPRTRRAGAAEAVPGQG